MDKPTRTLTVLLTALAAFGPVSIDIFLPSLPDMTREFNTGVSQIQLTLSVFIAGFAFAQLIYGPLSDHYGRRPVLLGGIILYFAASLLCLTGTSIHALIAGRFLQALGACAGPVLSRAIVRDIYPRDQAPRILATMASAVSIAPALGPLLGGFLHARFGWHSNFVVMALFGAVLLLASWKLLPETNRQKDQHALSPLHMLGNYGRLLTDPVFLGSTLTLSFLFAGMFSFISGGSFVLIDVIGVRPEHFGFCFAAVIAGFMIGSQVAARLTHRVGSHRMIAAGLTLAMLGALALAGLAAAGVQTVVSIIGPMTAMFMAAGMSLPNCTAIAIAPHARIAGSASALLGFMQMGIATVAGWIVGLVHNGTSLPMTLVIVSTTLVSLTAYWGLAARRQS